MNETLKNELENRTVEVQDLSADALMSVGFRKWSEEYEGLLLVPLWAFDLLPDGTELTSIFGRKVVKGVDAIDLDTRGGLLAFGIYGNKRNA